MKCKFCSLLPFCSIYFIPALLDCFLNMKFWNITYFFKYHKWNERQRTNIWWRKKPSPPPTQYPPGIEVYKLNEKSSFNWEKCPHLFERNCSPSLPCVSFIITQNSSLLTLPVTKCRGLFLKPLSNSLQHQLISLQHNSASTHPRLGTRSSETVPHFRGRSRACALVLLITCYFWGSHDPFLRFD